VWPGGDGRGRRVWRLAMVFPLVGPPAWWRFDLYGGGCGMRHARRWGPLVVMGIARGVWPPWRRTWRRGELLQQVSGPALALAVSVVGSRWSLVCVVAAELTAVLRADPAEGGKCGTIPHRAKAQPGPYRCRQRRHLVMSNSLLRALS
jgi:hypothetical protein